MRQKVTATRLEDFMKVLGSRVGSSTRVFLVGGATAVLMGWRDSTIDIDLKVVPDSDDVLKELAAIKERLELNVELASPDDFIPELPGWQERSRFIRQVGKLTFLHYDFYAQTLAKIERGHATDLRDVREMIKNNLIDPNRLLEFFSRIEGQLYKYPAVDPSAFRSAVQVAVLQGDQD